MKFYHPSPCLAHLPYRKKKRRIGFGALYTPPLLQHQALVGGPNPSCCPICNKLCMSGELLMEHMKFVHKDPNASGVPGIYYG